MQKINRLLYYWTLYTSWYQNVCHQYTEISMATQSTWIVIFLTKENIIGQADCYC